MGEAPEELRNVLRQRSRWCKGHMQVGARAGPRRAAAAKVGQPAGLPRTRDDPQRPAHRQHSLCHGTRTLQVFFSMRNPLLLWKLPLHLKILYNNGTWCVPAQPAATATAMLVQVT